MGLFAFKANPAPQPRPAPLPDPQWARNRNGNFFKFTTLDPYAYGLKGVGGIYVMWNSGVKPRWLLCGAHPDLGWALDMLEDDESVMDLSMHGLHITWSPIRAEYRSGVLNYLSQILAPELPTRGLISPLARPIPVLLPGQRPAAGSDESAVESKLRHVSFPNGRPR